LPPSDYPLWDALGSVSAGGKLSCLQLEGVLYAVSNAGCLQALTAYVVAVCLAVLVAPGDAVLQAA
jgi:hypothetical protein